MTLVLSCLTRDCVFQVSDRRLVRGTEIIDDNANKNIFYAPGIAFSYTGLAEIEGKRTDEWLLDALPEPYDDFVSVVREKATEAFTRLGLPRNSMYRRHAFAGVCWVPRGKWQPVRPTYFLISNFHQPNGEELRSVSDQFSVLAWELPENVIVQVLPVGQRVPKPQLEELHQNLKRCVKKKKGPTTVLRLLVMAMREVAEHNPAVGKNLLALGLPKVAANRARIVSPLSGTSMFDDVNTFLCIPADSQEGIFYMPALRGKGVSEKGYTRYLPGVIPPGMNLPPIA